MINTIVIHYDYDEKEGILPSGLPKGAAYCKESCPNLCTQNNFCDLFGQKVLQTNIGNDNRKAWVPAKRCRHHEMQGR